MEHCIEGYCPYEDEFPEDCPGEECWLRKMLEAMMEEQPEERVNGRS